MTEKFPTKAAARRPEIVSRTEKSVRKLNIFGPVLGILRTVFYLAILAAVIYLIFFSSIFKIKNVEISGVKSSEISDYLEKSLTGKNIILFLPGKYLGGLTTQFPIVQQVRIVRGLPNSVKVYVEERRQQLVWCSDKCFEIDNNGLAYQEIARPQNLVVVVDQDNLELKVGDRVISQDFIYFFLHAVDEIEKLGLKVSEADIKDTTFRLSFKTTEGWDIIFDTSASLENQVSALKQTVLNNRSDIHEYVDLRVEGVAYIK